MEIGNVCISAYCVLKTELGWYQQKPERNSKKLVLQKGLRTLPWPNKNIVFLASKGPWGHKLSQFLQHIYILPPSQLYCSALLREWLSTPADHPFSAVSTNMLSACARASCSQLSAVDWNGAILYAFISLKSAVFNLLVLYSTQACITRVWKKATFTCNACTLFF